MQSAESNTMLNRDCLVLALRRYCATVQNMEQTVLLPSLLRDVESDSDSDSDDRFQDCHSATGSSCKDLYDYYLMLKAVRNTVESGLVTLDDRKAKNQTSLAQNKTLEPMLEADPEALFHFHLRGLFSVMGNLTKKSQGVTTKYMDIIRIMN
ncbi:thyroid hormone-inducible hepatic protein [Salmo salar]|uniref:Thyroid hormone-inducible hepatic protein n=1 Tax=Salmo salar TaxID=8030 RepID=A0A1S3NUT8_SALSA|nr:mid1-interacting protein 1-B-like [Salmo salar]|eukprot:XP_014019167.1 PREDICTED: thyroid hormone-inducible hepatic protein [Salmo salar]